jgi:hypothetical protein
VDARITLVELILAVLIKSLGGALPDNDCPGEGKYTATPHCLFTGFPEMVLKKPTFPYKPAFYTSSFLQGACGL